MFFHFLLKCIFCVAVSDGYFYNPNSKKFIMFFEDGEKTLPTAHMIETPSSYFRVRLDPGNEGSYHIYLTGKRSKESFDIAGDSNKLLFKDMGEGNAKSFQIIQSDIDRRNVYIKSDNKCLKSNFVEPVFSECDDNDKTQIWKIYSNSEISEQIKEIKDGNLMVEYN